MISKMIDGPTIQILLCLLRWHLQSCNVSDTKCTRDLVVMVLWTAPVMDQKEKFMMALASAMVIRTG